jgi:hypothetical protein
LGFFDLGELAPAAAAAAVVAAAVVAVVDEDSGGGAGGAEAASVVASVPVVSGSAEGFLCLNNSSLTSGVRALDLKCRGTKTDKQCYSKKN